MKWRINEDARSPAAQVVKQKRKAPAPDPGRGPVRRWNGPAARRKGGGAGKKAYFFPRYYTKKASWPQGFPRYFLFYRYEKSRTEHSAECGCAKMDACLWLEGEERYKIWDFSEKYRNFGEKIKKVVDRGKMHPL